VQSHLASLGFIPGTELEIIRRDAGGPVIVAVRDGRMALGNGLACHLWVE
jgi:Fe2+ transport system protein FeoA